MSIKVMMIHGTFASDAQWVMPDSITSQRVSQQIAETSSVEAFRWSGANSFVERLKAARELVQLMERAPTDTRYILIAHSHGGSVVHYAYRLAPALFERVLGVACMATPFFGFSVRPGYGALFVAIMVVFTVLLMHALMTVIMVVSKKLSWNFDDGLIAPLSAAALVMAFVLALATALFKNRHRLYSWLGRGIAEVTQWDTTNIQVPRVAIFRSMGDEVALGLSTGQFLITLANRILGGMASMAEALRRLVARWAANWAGRGALLVFGSFTAFAAALPGAIQVSLGLNLDDFRLFMWIFQRDLGCSIDDHPVLTYVVCIPFQLCIWLDMLVVIGAILLSAMFLTGWLVSFLVLRLFGAWSPTAALTTVFAIEPTPEGLHSFCNTGWSRDAGKLEQERPLLQHSDPYSSVAALDALCLWVAIVSKAEPYA